MTVWQAIAYGVVQGLTEFLPISSTAHIRILPALLGWNDPGAPFTAVIQIGTLAAVLMYFVRDIVGIGRAACLGLVRGKPWETFEARLGWMIALGTVPIVVIGLCFQDEIEGTLRSLYVVSGSLIALALVLMGAEWHVQTRARSGHRLRTLTELGWFDAIAVGLAQALALLPGASRSGVTITSGLFLGMSRETAARFSFLLSLPSVFAAGVYQFWKHRHDLLASDGDVLNLLVATVVAGVAGYLSIAFLLQYLKTHTTYLFIVYRSILGGILLVLLWAGKLEP